MLAHETQTGRVAAVTVILDSTTDAVLKEFHCNGCGRVMFKYYGALELIFPDASGEGTLIERLIPPKIIQCKNRRRIWLISATGQQKEVESRCKMLYNLIG